MNQVLRDLDVIIGEGNPGAVGIRHQAAEGSAIEDCTIDATHGLAGIDGGIGSGGCSSGVTVIGGRIGLDIRTSQPTPTITGITLIGQTEAAIRYSGRQTLVAVGLKIVANKISGPAIVASGGLEPLFSRQGPNDPHNGHLSLIDSQIVFEGGPRGGSPQRVAIASSRNVYLNNVYFRGATHGVVDPEDGRLLAGNPEGWLHVREFAHGSRYGGKGDLRFQFSVYVEGKRQESDLVDVAANETPPEDLQLRHLWSADLPGWESPGAANVKLPPYNAKGDGRTDDTAAIQRALNEHEVVFLPKGYYVVSRTIELGGRTKLIGLAQHLSTLVPSRAKGEFATGNSGAPLVRTADAVDATTALVSCTLWAARNMQNVYAVHWRAGAGSLFRGVEIFRQPIRSGESNEIGQSDPPAIHPSVLIAGNGGGKWYRYHQGGQHPQTPSYCHVLIDGTTQPLRFYQCSPQHVPNHAAVEVRGARDVSVFGTKYEGNTPILWIHDSDRIRVFGHGGNGKGRKGESLFLVERTPNFLLANLVDGQTRIGAKYLDSVSTDPREFFMVVERPKAARRSRPCRWSVQCSTSEVSRVRPPWTGGLPGRPNRRQRRPRIGLSPWISRACKERSAPCTASTAVR